MKSIQNKQNAINMLLEKKEKQFIEDMADLQLKKKKYSYKIELIQRKLNIIPIIKVGDLVDLNLIQNNNNFSAYLHQSKDAIEKEIRLIDTQYSNIQTELFQLLNKKKALNNYFEEIKKRKKHALDKKEEAILQDQFNSLKKIFGFSIEEL